MDRQLRHALGLRRGVLALLLSLATAGVSAGPVLASTTRWQLKINGMVCSFCARGIENKLSAVPGVSDIRIDMKTKTIRLLTNGSFKGNPDTLNKAVRDAGYVVQSIEQSPAQSAH